LAAGIEPGAVASPYSAYCSVIMVTASDSPIRPSSQPMALAGRRAVISRLVPAYNPTATARMASTPIRTGSIWPTFSASSTSAAARTSTANPVSNQDITHTWRRRPSDVDLIGASIGTRRDHALVFTGFRPLSRSDRNEPTLRPKRSGTVTNFGPNLNIRVLAASLAILHKYMI